MIAYPTVLLYGVPVWVLLSRTGELTYWRVILASLLPGIFLSAGVGSLQLLPSMEIYSILLVSVIWFINKRLTVKAQEI
ncbi:MAG: hypothetical protein R3F41_13925 [Gammaproteobacteria bacterium]|nr:hypothetical protein [Pseudomonadales bacterium]